MPGGAPLILGLVLVLIETASYLTHIVPVHKKGDKHLPSNYRPISLTSIVVKVMERIIHRQLVSALESKQLINDAQHGFRHKRSTVTLLIAAVNNWASCLERRNSVNCVLLDLAKAFDSVPHYHLLLRLESLGVRGNLLSWFNSFLTKCYQRVVINGCFSDWLPVCSGVPQGSVLGPLLFLLYIDEVNHIVSNSVVKLFADDIALYKEIVSPYDQKLLQEDLTKIYQWSQLWQLNLNPRKCESICISFKRSPRVCEYHLNSQSIPTNSVVHYLGIYIISHLKWKDHVKHVSAKASRTLNFLRHSFFASLSVVKATAYNCLVRPLLEYASPVWYLHTNKDIKYLEAIQCHAARWVCGSRWNPHSHQWSKSSTSGQQELKWPSLQTRRKYFAIA